MIKIHGYSRRDCGTILGLAAATLGGAPASLAKTVSSSGTFDPLPFVNPELRPLISNILPMLSAPLVNYQDTLKGRSAPTFGQKPTSEPLINEISIAGRAGTPAVRLYVINPGKKTKPQPAVLYIHGGGYIIGTAAAGLGELQELAIQLGSTIVTVDYRLSPETPFPGPLEDCYSALKWIKANAAQIGVDPSLIAVAGDSAGGGLAAMLAIAARDRKEVSIAYQCLIYPMLDDRTGSSVQRPKQQGALVWKPESNRYGWTSFLGVPAGSAKVPYGAVPARVEDLRGLPPTFIGVGTIDLFYEENLEYARRLAAAGVQVELAIAPGGFHGFTLFKQTELVKRFDQHKIQAFRSGLHLPSQ